MLNYRFVRFLIVGFTNTLIGLLIIYSCKWLFEMGDIIANFIGYGIGMILGFMLNKNWTFKYKGKITPTFLRYIFVLISAYLINLSTVIYAINYMLLDSYLAQTLGILPYTLTSYLGSRFFVFHKSFVG
jgi:putative flippase GtrA